jgi:hypothetical protein
VGSVVSVRAGTALLERCPRCCDHVVGPLRVWRLEVKTVAVFQCECLHAWFTTYNATGLGAGDGAEPVRIGEAL